MDNIDNKILSILQQHGRISNQDLADQVNLSPAPCLRRVKQLEKAGYISQYTALLNPDKFDLGLTIFVSIGLNDHQPETVSAFEQLIQSFPEIMQCYLIAGQAEDYLLRVNVKDMEHFHRFLLKELTQIKGVNNVKSSFALRTIVNKTALPLPTN